MALMRVIRKFEVSNLFIILVRHLIYFLFFLSHGKNVCNTHRNCQFHAKSEKYVSTDGTTSYLHLLNCIQTKNCVCEGNLPSEPFIVCTTLQSMMDVTVSHSVRKSKGSLAGLQINNTTQPIKS